VGIDRVQGTVNTGDTLQCNLSFCPPMRMALRGCELALKVRERWRGGGLCVCVCVWGGLCVCV
jgi:hypothetical protein